MAIRRIREHAAGHNWFAVAVDLVIVIIGVFIGIQASNWNAGRIERGEVRAYRAQIIQDLRSNEREIAARDHYYRQAREHSLAALAALEKGAANEEAFLIDTYQASQVWPLRLERSAYDELIASGMAKSFADNGVRQRLSAYYAAMPSFESTALGTTAYREQVRREMKFAVQDRMRERCDDVFTPVAEGLPIASLPERCTLQLPASLISLAAARLKATPELEQDLTRHIGDLDQKIANFGRWGARARERRVELERLDD